MHKSGRSRVQIGPGNTAVLQGQDDVTTWSDEELLYGRRKDKSGSFRGRQPSVVPRAVHQEIARRMVRIVWESGIPAARTIQRQAAGELIASPAEESIMRQSAVYVLDRLLGKAPERVELDVSSSVDPLSTPPPWVAQMVAQLAAQGEGEVIDVTPVDPLDDDTPWDEEE